MSNCPFCGNVGPASDNLLSTFSDPLDYIRELESEVERLRAELKSEAHGHKCMTEEVERLRKLDDEVIQESQHCGCIFDGEQCVTSCDYHSKMRNDIERLRKIVDLYHRDTQKQRGLEPGCIKGTAPQ